MNITIDPEVEQRIEQKLKDGRYSSSKELLSAAMDALSRQEAQDAAMLDLRAKVAVGIQSADRGDLSDGDEFFAELEREYEAADARNSGAH